MKRWLAILVGVLLVAMMACAGSPEAVGFSAPAADAASAPGDELEAGGGGGSGFGDAATWSPYLRGALAVQARGCPACHQSGDASDGVLSGQGTPVPGTRIYGPNLTPDPETGIGALTDSQILRMLRLGKDEEGKPLCAVMPRFVDMGVDEESAILVYLRALTPVHREIPNGVCALIAIDGGDGGLDGGAANACPGLAGPEVTAPCHACLHPPCQANGCFNGFVCVLATAICQPPGPGCD